MELKFVSAAPDSIEEIYSCLRELHLFCEPYIADEEAALMEIYRRVRDNIGEYTLVKCNGRPAAFFYFHEDSGMMKIEDLYVFAEFRCKGIATSILRRCMSETELPIKAELYANNRYAVSLFQHHGFTKTEWIDGRRYVAVNNNDFPYIPELYYSFSFDDSPVIL